MKHRLLVTSLLALVLAGASAHASTLYWSGNGTALGGVGTWNTTGANWGTSTSGPFTTVWNNANSDSAFLSGLSTQGGTGLVTLGVPITMNGTLTWQQTPGTYPSYSIVGSSTLTFSAGSTLNCNNSVGGGIYVGYLNAPYAGTITKTGTGLVNFNNNNGNVTKFIFQAGTVNFSGPTRFGSGVDRSDFLTMDGGAWRGDVTAWGSVGKSMSLTANGGTVTAFSSATVITMDKPITSTGAGRLTVSGVQLTLSNTGNSWTGPMTISGTGGKLTLGAANVIPDTCWVTVSATLNLNGFSETIFDLDGTGSVTLGAGTLTLTRGSHTFSGAISGSGGFTLSGGAGETLSGNNTYTGPTTVNAGPLIFSGASTCTGITTVNSGGTLRIATSGTAFPDSPINLASSGSTLDVNNLSVTIAALSGTGVVSNNASQTLTVNGNLTTGGGTGTGLYVYS